MFTASKREARHSYDSLVPFNSNCSLWSENTAMAPNDAAANATMPWQAVQLMPPRQHSLPPIPLAAILGGYQDRSLDWDRPPQHAVYGEYCDAVNRNDASVSDAMPAPKKRKSTSKNAAAQHQAETELTTKMEHLASVTGTIRSEFHMGAIPEPSKRTKYNRVHAAETTLLELAAILRKASGPSLAAWKSTPLSDDQTADDAPSHGTSSPSESHYDALSMETDPVMLRARLAHAERECVEATTRYKDGEQRLGNMKRFVQEQLALLQQYGPLLMVEHSSVYTLAADARVPDNKSAAAVHHYEMATGVPLQTSRR